MTTIEAEVTVGSKAPDLTLPMSDGAPIQLSNVWSGKPVALVFLSPLNGAIAPECATLWRDAEEKMVEAGGEIIAVCAAPASEGENFRRRWHLPYALLCDGGTAYTTYGVGGSQPGSFVIDTDGLITFVHRNADELDYAPTWDLIDAVSAITGKTVVRPSLTPPGESADVAQLDGEAFSTPTLDGTLKFTCAKCSYTDYEVLDVSSTSGMMSRMVNLQNRRFSAVVCRRCQYTEFYKAESGALRNIFDLLVGS